MALPGGHLWGSQPLPPGDPGFQGGLRQGTSRRLRPPPPRWVQHYGKEGNLGQLSQRAGRQRPQWIPNEKFPELRKSYPEGI